MTQLLTKIAAKFNTTLNLKTAIGATSATLDSATDDSGVALPTGRYGLTIDGGTASEEFITCTLTGTALTSIKTVTMQGTETSGMTKTHRKGATVKITDFVVIKKMLDVLDGTTDFDSGTPLGYDGDPGLSSGTNKFATVNYVDGVAIAGGADASTTVKGITKLSTAPASATNPIAVGDNDDRVPTQDENDALVGTSGTPSTSNKYVTNDDTATAATADKVARRLAGGNITVVTETTGNNTTNAASTAFVQQELATVLVSVPEQEIPFYVSANTGYATNSQVGTNITGSVMALVTYHSTTTLEIRRLAKVTGVGQYIVTHSTTLAGTSFSNRPSVAITGSYIYVCVNDNGTGILRRYDIADLANVTSMTISGTAIGTNPSAGFSDGTDLYFYNGTTDQFNKYTISGTTATFSSTITYTSAGVLSNGGACSDGTSVWTIVSASGSNTIYKYPIAGGSSTGNAVRFFYTSAYNNPGKLGLSINKSGFLNVHLGYTMESNSAIVASAIKLNAIAQP